MLHYRVAESHASGFKISCFILLMKIWEIFTLFLFLFSLIAAKIIVNLYIFLTKT